MAGDAVGRSIIHERIGEKRALLAVIHPAHGVLAASRAIGVALENGAHGAMLIDQGMGADELMGRLLPMVREEHHGAFIGANLLNTHPHLVVGRDGHRLDAVWSDYCGADSLDCRESLLHAQRMRRAVAETAWGGLYFGGVAFKTARQMTDDEARLACVLADHVDVITTSGPATGHPPSVERITLIRHAIGDRPLAIASGITPDNVAPFLVLADAFLVATGIESSFGVLDPAKVRALADAVREG